jgi:hypothetical protein
MKRTKYVITVIAAAAMLAALLSGCVEEKAAVEVVVQSPVPEKTEVRLISGSEYTVSEMLYYSPDSSEITMPEPGIFYQIGSDGSVNIVDALSGEVLESYSGGSEYKEIDEDEWESLFTCGLTVDISSYSERVQYDASDNYRFYLLDDEVWLGTVRDGKLLSLFKMTANTAK